MLFGLVVLEGLRDSIIFLTSISSVKLRKEEFILIEVREKIMNIIF